MQFWSDEGGIRSYYPLREGSQIIGRHPSCHIVLPGRRVSKKHLQCCVENGVVTIRDLGSSNGTTVNGTPVTTCILKHGDEVALGGHRLVLDMESDAAAAGAPAGDPAAASFDYEPSGAPPPREPGTDVSFDEEPSADDTPVDGAFVPTAYTPQALQPQVVARDGRMYLRDPRTHREVEIVPRREGLPAELDEYYARKNAAEKKKNTLLIGAAIGVAVLMIVALALMTGSEPTRKPVRKRAFSQARYTEMTHQALDRMRQGDFKKAISLLQAAHKVYPELQVAGALLEIAKRWGQSGKSVEEFNWRSVESLLRELRDGDWSTATVRDFAKKRIDWIYNLENLEAIAKKALEHLAAGDPEKAYEEFQKIPPDTLVYRQYREQMAATRTACFQRRLRLARAAMAQGRWTVARQEYLAARKFADDLGKTRIETGLALADKRLREEAVLNDAHEMMREDTVPALKSALKRLEAIEEDSPLTPRRDALRKRILARIEARRLKKLEDRAWNYYKAGDGLAAIQHITQHQLENLYPLRRRIQKILDLMKQARDAVVRKDYNAAKALWTEVAQEEPDARNHYHKAAVERLRALAADAQKIALEYNRKGDAAFKNDRPEKAREYYLEALKWDPRGKIGSNGLASLRHMARVYYNKGINLRFNPDTKKQALDFFVKCRRYATPGSDLHKNAMRNERELRAEIELPPQ